MLCRLCAVHTESQARLILNHHLVLFSSLPTTHRLYPEAEMPRIEFSGDTLNTTLFQPRPGQLLLRDFKTQVTPNETQRNTLIVAGVYVVAIFILWWVSRSKIHEKRLKYVFFFAGICHI